MKGLLRIICVVQCSYKGPEKKGKSGLKVTGNVITAAEVEMRQMSDPKKADNLWKSPERKRIPPPHFCASGETHSPASRILDFWAPELLNTEFVLLRTTRVVLISYNYEDNERIDACVPCNIL